MSSRWSPVPHLIIVAHIFVGIVVMISVGEIPRPQWLSPAVFLCLGFAFLNIIESRLLKVDRELIAYWSPRRLHWLVLGIPLGAVIGILPDLVEALANPGASISYSTDFALAHVFGTLLIVAWEELWFRGIVLNRCARSLSPLTISLWVGFLFMSVHVLNPELDLVVVGPSLFFAGAMLTMLYFHLRSIWAPIGVHFGNNFFNTAIETTSGDPVWGEDGYFTALLLATIFLLIVMRSRTLSARPATRPATT